MKENDEGDEPIHEMFQIDELDLEDRAQTSDYWMKAYEFYLQVKDKDISDVSEKVIDWLRKIEYDLNER